MLSIYFLTTCPWQRDVQYGVEYGPRWRRLEGGDDALFDRTDILYWNGSSRYLGEKKESCDGSDLCLTRPWWCFPGRSILGCSRFGMRGRFAVRAAVKTASGLHVYSLQLGPRSYCPVRVGVGAGVVGVGGRTRFFYFAFASRSGFRRTLHPPLPPSPFQLKILPAKDALYPSLKVSLSL